MIQEHSRYPGAQPFVDTPLSRAVFFGREKESNRLADLILSTRLVVVYAKSGVGKTSLLQAGVAQLLRDDGRVPLLVRVNDPKQDPVGGVLDGVGDAAKEQGVEYHPGERYSLWHFFKTAEFWRGDHMLTPVLVLDQFEELFTLHDADARARFLRELGPVVRGVRPVLSAGVHPSVDAQIGDTPPSIHIVISMREDFLGALEEAADTIPQILDTRFRLSALTMDAAAEAIERPSQVALDELTTKPFRYIPGTVEAILGHLSRRTRRPTSRARQYIEPFQLQLIGQRVESIAAKRQGQAVEGVEISFHDLGGAAGLDATLRDFVKNVLATIQSRRARGRVRRLCRGYLISPEGRRLSMALEEIKRIFKLDAETLEKLVDRRLLRADQRGDSWYLELSHDSLIAPILASHKRQALTLGGLSLVGSSVVALSSVGVLALGPILLFFAWIGDMPREELLFVLIGTFAVVLLGGLMMWVGAAGVRRSVETLNRYTAPL